METYHIYKGSIYDKNGRLIGKHTENTVFTEYGAWEMHETDGNYYLRAVGASINGVLVGQDIRGNLIAIGTNAFLTADKENQILRCYDFRGNLIWFTGYQGSIGDPPLIVDNILLTSNAAYDLAIGEEIEGYEGHSRIPHVFVFEGKLYGYWRRYSHQDSTVYQINPRTGDVIRSFEIRPGLYSWFGNIHYGYATTPAGITGGLTVRKYDLDTGEMLFSVGLHRDHYGNVYILGDNIYIHNQATNEWLKVVQVGDTWGLEPTSEQRIYEKDYLVSQTLAETFTAHIEEEAPQNPVGMIRPSQVTIRDEEIETGYEFTASYRYPLNQDVELIAENITVIAAYVNDKSINFNQEGTKLTLSADDINAALSEAENPTYYRQGNKLIEKRNITVILETDKQTTIVTVIQERLLSGNLEEDVSEGIIDYDPERDEPLYPDDPDYEEEKPQYPPVPGEEPLVFGDDGYPYSEDRGPIWSNHPDHPAFGIEEMNIIPSEAEIFPNQETEFEIEIAYKEGMSQTKPIEEIINISYSQESLEVQINKNKIKVTGIKLTNEAYIEATIKGKFYGDRKRKMTSRADIRVVSPIQNISITPSEVVILHEQTQDFEVEVFWKEGAEQQDVSQYITFTWPNLLEAEQSGNRLTVTATRPVRNARIRAVLEGELLGWHAAEATLTVKQLIESIQIIPKNATLVKGQRQEFQVEITWAEGAQEKPLEEICDVTSDSAILVTEITGNRIEVVSQKIALNARLVVKVKDEFLPPTPSSYLRAIAYIRVISFRELIPNYPPLSALRLRFKAGTSSYEMGNYLIDRYSYKERDTVVNLECRNRIGHYLRDQHVGDNRNFIGTGSEVLEDLLEAANVQAFVVQQEFDDEVHLELSAKNTFLDAIGQVLELKPGWVIRQHRHDGVYPGNYEGILIGDSNFMADGGIFKGVYVFRRDRDIFSREVTKTADSVYGRVCVHTPGFDVELYKMVDNDLAINSLKTYFYEVPDGTTEQQAQQILNRLTNMLKHAGKIETFVTAFRPQIEPGDLAFIQNENGEEEEVGIITSVSHNFGKHGFFSEFTIDSSGLVEKETLLKMTMKRVEQEPNIRTKPNRHKITFLTGNS